MTKGSGDLPRAVWLALFIVCQLYLPARGDEQPPRRSTGYLASSRAQRKATLVDPAWRRAWPGPTSDTSAAPAGSAKGEIVLRTAQAPEALPPGRTMPEAVPLPRKRRPADAQLELRPMSEGNWNLEQLTELALENNPVIRRARSRIEAARGVAWQAGIWANPRWDTNNPYVLFAGLQQAYNAGFTQEFFVKGKKRLDREAAMQQVRETTFAALSDRYDVLQSVREQFYGVLIQQRRVRGLEEVLRVTTGARDAAQRLYDNQQVAETDVLLLALEMQKTDAALAQANAQLIAKRRQLAAVVGLPGMPIGEVAGDPAGPPPPFDGMDVRRFVAQQNVDVLNARAEVLRTSVVLERAQAEPYPNPIVGPAAQWGPLNTNQQFWLNIYCNIPVWDFNQGGISSARWDTRRASADVGVTQNRLLEQAADALGRHRAAVQLAEKIRAEILPTARRNFELVERGYRGGILPVFQFLEAQRSLFDANLSYIDALEDVWSSAAQLGNLLQLEQYP